MELSVLNVSIWSEKGKNFKSICPLYFKRWLMATQLKPMNSHRLFPIFDDMKFKARFSLSVSRPREMRVLSNMPLKTSNDS